MRIFRTNNLSCSTYSPEKLPQVFEVYRQCEDFLALGPVPKASLEMVKDDIRYATEEKGVFCCIHDLKNQIIGILDFIPKAENNYTSFLSLLMISASLRRRGYGKELLEGLEQYLKKTYGIRLIKSAVQTNNRDAIQFWKRIGYNIDDKPVNRPDGTVVYPMHKVII
jgi:GNAT superfamily N-acetyltransferase